MEELVKSLTERLEELEKKFEERQNEITAKQAEILLKDLRIQKLQHRIDQLLRQLYGVKSEKLPAQMGLFPTLEFSPEELAPVEQIEKTTSVPAHERKQRKTDPESLRNQLPEHLRREDVVIEPSDIPEGAVKIGEEISEKLEITKAELYVKRTIRPKYAKADKSGVVIADLPQAPIYRCLAGTSLLVRILIDKYVDHLPLNRQMDRFSRQGVKLKDSTVCDWVSQVAKLLEVLYDKFTQEVLSSRYLGADETTVKVLDPKVQGKCHTGYLWVYLCHEKNLVLFDYDPSRRKEVVGNKLQHFTGYLQSDGYAGYEQFSSSSSVTRVGCMAHARRKFDEALKNDQKTALYAMTLMQRLYRLEHWMKVYSINTEGKAALRQRIATPILKHLFEWMEVQVKRHTPKSAIYQALQYSLALREELSRYTQDGVLHIDNNLVENKIRPVVIGRKNYLFMGSHESGQRTAMLYSFFVSCRAHGIDPEEWLEDVLSRINDTKTSELNNLLPHRWSKA